MDSSWTPLGQSLSAIDADGGNITGVTWFNGVATTLRLLIQMLEPQMLQVLILRHLHFRLTPMMQQRLTSVIPR